MDPEHESYQDSPRPQTLTELAAEGSGCREYEADDEADAVKRVDDSEDEGSAVNASEADPGEEIQEEYQDIEVQGVSDDELPVGVDIVAGSGSVCHRNVKKELGLKECQDLRERALREGDRADDKGYVSDSVLATDIKRAQRLREEAREHRIAQQRLNREASIGLFKLYNRAQLPNRIDLHGQHVREAILSTDDVIKKIIQAGGSDLAIIVGKGLHTEGPVPRLKPAIMKHVQRLGHLVEVDLQNPGILLVSLSQEAPEL